jgi:hypothetical protein
VENVEKLVPAKPTVVVRTGSIDANVLELVVGVVDLQVRHAPLLLADGGKRPYDAYLPRAERAYTLRTYTPAFTREPASTEKFRQPK